MQEALRTYLELATGLTEASRKTVKKAVKDAVGRTGATAGQAKALTSELLSMNAANREALVKLVRFEVDRALGVVGLATADEVTELTARVRDLERQLKAAQAAGGGGEPTKKAAAPSKARAARRATAAAETTTPRRATTTSAAPRKTAAKATTAGRATKAAKATAATKAPARKA